MNSLNFIDFVDSELEYPASSNTEKTELFLDEEYKIDRFVEPPRKDFLCPICKNVVKSPLECWNCGVLICKYCVNCCSVQNTKKKLFCPICCDFKCVRQPSPILLKIITNQLVFCKNKLYSCNKTCALNDIKAHEEICEYIPIHCSNVMYCNKLISKKASIEVTLPKSSKNFKIKYVCSKPCKKVFLMNHLLKSNQAESAIKEYVSALLSFEKRSQDEVFNKYNK